MPRFTYLLLEGEKIEMDVNPDEINAVPIVLGDHLIIYAVASKDDQWKLLELQKKYWLKLFWLSFLVLVDHIIVQRRKLIQENYYDF